MSLLEKVILKRVSKFTVIESVPGRIKLKSNAPESVYEQVEPYDKELKIAILFLDGIERVELDYNRGIILIRYDITKVNDRKVLKWIDSIVKIGLENKEVISKYSSTDMNYLEELLEEKLQEEIEKF